QMPAVCSQHPTEIIAIRLNAVRKIDQRRMVSVPRFGICPAQGTHAPHSGRRERLGDRSWTPYFPSTAQGTGLDEKSRDEENCGGEGTSLMDAIILAAGLGTRLRPHTLTTPKPLLPVRGRPILDWTLGALPASIDRVLVVVNYLAEQIDAYLASQKHIHEWKAVRQQEPRGTGDAVRGCREDRRPHP